MTVPKAGTPKPCPFCGDANVSVEADRNQTRNVIVSWVECLKCDASGPMADSEHEAVRLWNGRLS